MLRRICNVSSGVVGSTITFWKRRSSAPSFSIFFRYSSSVVAPIHCISPLASAGFSMLAASKEPAAPPAPTMVCISSINRMMFGFFESSFKIALMRSSNWPRYLVPATIDAISSAITRLSNNARDTFFWFIRSASPSTMADLPTPGSPINTGLFFFRRLNICAIRSISLSRPTTGSKRFSSAARVISVPKLSNTGVSDPAAFACEGLPGPPPGLNDLPLISSSSSVKSAPARRISSASPSTSWLWLSIMLLI